MRTPLLLALGFVTVMGLGFGLRRILVGHGVGPTPTSVSQAAAKIPSFGQPEERARYLSAMIEGDRRALEVITRGIDEARAQPRPDLEHVAGLERARAERAARLAAHESAARGL